MRTVRKRRDGWRRPPRTARPPRFPKYCSAHTSGQTTPTVSIRIAPEDIARARGLAEKKGLRYQTYLKMLLHEALEREQKRMAG